jgi:histidyl-tRNA synthetase
LDKVQQVRGTKDIFPAEMAKYNSVIDKARSVSKIFGFDEASFPLLEKSQVFTRPLGESSDVVSKEMYSFNDRGGDSITLRPEGTAGIIRSILSNGKLNDLPLKLFYSGPMFRYERPQKGRLRQFTQIGIESIGNPDALEDVEVILCGIKILSGLGIEKNCILNINTLGDNVSRNEYKKNLVKYFLKNDTQLSELSKNRLSLNPLRILDSKEIEDQEIIKNAPLFSSFLNNSSIDHFEKVLKYLKKLDVEFIHNEKLVRGLDYYSHTTFEFITEDLGTQGTVLGGGRYDGLSEMLGGPHIPAVGFAAGVDRLVMMNKLNNDLPVAISIIPIQKENFDHCYSLMNTLRNNNIRAETYPGGNVSKYLKKINKKNQKIVILIGDKEIENKKVVLKNLSTGDQFEVQNEELIKKINMQSD